MTTGALLPPPIRGHGLELRPWDDGLAEAMARWSSYGFPYHAFDLAHLAEPARARAEVARHSAAGQHRHFVACEDGRAVGRVSVNMQDESGLYLWAVHVPPEHQGRGVCRRMLATLMEWLEREVPNKEFVLSTNTFAEHAHRAYFALGFRITESRWHFDRELAERLWKVTPEEREPIARHLRFHAGRWEVRVHIMRRARGAPLETESRVT